MAPTPAASQSHALPPLRPTTSPPWESVTNYEIEIQLDNPLHMVIDIVVDHNMAKKREILKKVGHELKENPPRILSRTRHKFGVSRAESQRKAILLSKARKMGARIPKG
jgi:hypothetical protein